MMRRALVTGAGGRVGRAIAVELARHGFEVAIHYHRSETGARETLDVVCSVGGEGWIVGADLADTTECRALTKQVSERWDGLEVLVHNASVFEPVPIGDIDDAAWDHMLAVNLRAPFVVTRELLPLLRAGRRPTDGATDGEASLVVHMCDIGAQRPLSGYTHYSVSKAGLVMLVRAMAVELAPTIRCVGISPGQVDWPADYGDQQRASISRRIPMKRVGTPDDIARLVRFLSLEAPYVNGEVIAVDGGLSCRY